MKKTEWNEASVARRNADGGKKDGLIVTTTRKTVERKAVRKGQAAFADEVLQAAIQGIINNQVP
jgi:hypothetical protein